jgi:hypothetical protein
VTGPPLFADPARQAAVLRDVAQRPWPAPSGPWLLAQTWEDLLFAHWPVPADSVRALLPEGIEVDLFDGQAWVGVVPFRLTGLRLRGLLPAPGVSRFLELNVRTCVVVDGRPGVWFFSLDAGSGWAVETARRTYKLPYFRARISAVRHGDEVEYASSRPRPVGGPAVFSGRYAPIGDLAPAAPGSLEHFLIERFCLYAVDRGRVLRAEIHHPPWPLQPARAEIDLNTMPPEGIELPDAEPLLHFSARQDVVIWPLRPVA